MNSHPATGDHPAQRWISATFGDVDPSVLMEQARDGCGRAPKTGRDGRSVTEEKVFIIVGIALEKQGVDEGAVDRLARSVVRSARTSVTNESSAAIEALLSPWGLPQDVLAHVVRILSRVVKGD